MKESIKKILKKVLVTIVVIIVLYNVVFDTVAMPREEAEEIEEKYDDFVLFSSRPPIWYLKKIFPPIIIVYEMYNYYIKFEGVIGLEESDRNIVLFRWKTSELKKQLESEIVGDLEEFKQSGYISDYTYDKEIMHLDIFIDTADLDKYWEARRYIEDVWQKDKLETLGALRGIRGRSTYVEIHKVMPNKEEPEIETKEYVYDEQEIDLLNEIISRSHNKSSFDFRNENEIKGDSENGKGGYIWYLDLSDYSDITGKLDLSGFANLGHVVLRGMKIDSVILPKSLVSIEPDTFKNCKNITQITIPKSVASFSNPVFSGCKNLKEIVFEGNAPVVSWENEDIFGKVPEDLIIYRKKSAKGWQEICWDKYDVRIIDE